MSPCLCLCLCFPVSVSVSVTLCPRLTCACWLQLRERERLQEEELNLQQELDRFGHPDQIWERQFLINRLRERKGKETIDWKAYNDYIERKVGVAYVVPGAPPVQRTRQSDNQIGPHTPIRPGPPSHSSFEGTRLWAGAIQELLGEGVSLPKVPPTPPLIPP